ncbi:MAG: MlaD family protein [Treponema sp.]|jgi:phospholipid/cholesterol/gamma-HCH transport system substrate-binding protein|nr:MlaD family protein [Treponema sp.]
MKFRIRFADQIVGFFVIIAIAILIVVVILIGSKQRWFVQDPTYKTYFSSAHGLGENMAIIYKGFPIGNVKSFALTDDDEVEVVFSIHREYSGRVTEGSLVELNVSPIGLGNSFVFYPGLGEDFLTEGSFIPTVSSPEGQSYIQRKLASTPEKRDSITTILSQVEEIAKNLNIVLLDVETAFEGTDQTSLGRTFGGVEATITGVRALPAAVESALAGVNDMLASLQVQLNETLRSLQPILTDVNALTGKLNEPDGLVYSALDTDGPLYTGLVKTLDSLSATIKNLDDTTKLLPGQLPGILLEVRNALKSVNDLLISLENNPLFKNGIPAQVETQSSGANPRDVEF